MRELPVAMTRQWDSPTKDELVRIFEVGILIHATTSANDIDSFLEPRTRMAKDYLAPSGRGFRTCSRRGKGDLMSLSCYSVSGLLPLLLIQSKPDRLTGKLDIEDRRPSAGAGLTRSSHRQIASL